MLLKVTDNLSVNPDHVVSLQPNSDRGHLVMTMQTGERHVIPCDYRKSCWETNDRIFKLLNREAT